MSVAWEDLCDWGVPWGAIRKTPTRFFDDARVTTALTELAATDFGELDPSMRECLLAWLRAFQHHWSDRFERTLGIRGLLAIGLLDDGQSDPNRYLKLRRIATENLATRI